MDNCIFCKIVKKEIPSHIIFEDENFLAFLDINPNTKGVTLVIPKSHVGSTMIDLDNQIFTDTLITAKKISENMAKKLDVQKVGLAIEGTGVDHFHVKLYPFYLQNQDNHTVPERIFNEYYPGYLTTQLGPQASTEDLKKVQEDLQIKD